MGRGRQKAKQTKIARKLKYLTTDTDYDQLAKELRQRESGEARTDPFEVVEEQFGAGKGKGKGHTESSDREADNAADRVTADLPVVDDDLDDYARWAAEAAAKATSGEIPAVAPKRKPIPIPVPSVLKRKPVGKSDAKPAAISGSSAGEAAKATGKSPASGKSGSAKKAAAAVTKPAAKGAKATKTAKTAKAGAAKKASAGKSATTTAAKAKPKTKSTATGRTARSSKKKAAPTTATAA
ncbi:hypothetical protein CRD59_02520 [Bifidobacterium xylocopae]|uniref:DUF3073 domain-containing protein n=1 Tax=Bifidobacterium xylocopae TaxID=2493119 RepID=A0A366KD34_9BIFI|nr:hypothetical protein CRD59_02520 [Bifidobacterium xylocopae]